MEHGEAERPQDSQTGPSAPHRPRLTTNAYLTTVCNMDSDDISDGIRHADTQHPCAGVTIETADPAGDEARACLAYYFEELQRRFDTGFDPAASVSADPEELVPPSGWFLLARLGGEAVGCGALKVQEQGFGELKRMWVAPQLRGLGLARRLLAALEAQAAAAGVRVLRLDTSRHLPEARALYIKSGYVEIAAYNDNPYADHWFEKRVS